MKPLWSPDLLASLSRRGLGERRLYSYSDKWTSNKIIFQAPSIHLNILVLWQLKRLATELYSKYLYYTPECIKMRYGGVKMGTFHKCVQRYILVREDLTCRGLEDEFAHKQVMLWGKMWIKGENMVICYIARLSLNKMSTVIGWFSVTWPWSNSNVFRPGYNCNQSINQSINQ